MSGKEALLLIVIGLSLFGVVSAVYERNIAAGLWITSLLGFCLIFYNLSKKATPPIEPPIWQTGPNIIEVPEDKWNQINLGDRIAFVVTNKTIESDVNNFNFITGQSTQPHYSIGLNNYEPVIEYPKIEQVIEVQKPDQLKRKITNAIGELELCE